MLKCANCSEVLCDENDILDRIENDDYDECMDGGYCFDIECEKCSYVNNVFAETETQISFISID